MGIEKLQKLQKKVYHLCGSPSSNFFFELSLIYSRNVICPSGWNQSFIVVDPDYNWFYGDALSSLDPQDPIEIITSLSKDALIVPHMFCKRGMTLYRSFFNEQLGFSMVGSTADVMKKSIDKNLSRNLVSQNNVTVAPGELLRQGCKPKIPYPIIVKPNSEDNSSGVSLVREEAKLESALKIAYEFDSEVLIEAFIPGRELRVAVIELENDFYIPSIIEYPVSEKLPIRMVSDKLELNENGLPNSQAKNSKIAPKCPAEIEPVLLKTIRDQAIRAHQALGARHYSLFDFRLDSRTGQVVFLEAGLFWSFSDVSMISTMINKDGRSLETIIDNVWTSALGLKT